MQTKRGASGIPAAPLSITIVAVSARADDDLVLLTRHHLRIAQQSVQHAEALYLRIGIGRGTTWLASAVEIRRIELYIGLNTPACPAGVIEAKWKACVLENS